MVDVPRILHLNYRQKWKNFFLKAKLYLIILLFSNGIIAAYYRNTMAKKTVILDNGAHTVKAEYSSATNPRIFPNAVIKAKNDRKRIYVADELEECQDRSSLFFLLPFERGYLVNWDTQLQNSRLVLTDPSDLAKAMNDVSHEVVFETYQFDSFLRTSASSCVAHYSYMSSVLSQSNEYSRNSCCLVVDSSHSFTHIVPFVEGQIVRSGIIRVEVGGKALTNQLKEWISFRYMNVLEETYMINQCKEDVCFVSTDLHKDMEKCQQQK
uniref:Uncharacterized protein n=1 Tax=Ditylenchus dipsaci TaxID=166011 RepID=A0A915DAS8_9BILA